MHIPSGGRIPLLDILFFEYMPVMVGPGYDPEIQSKGESRDKEGSCDVWPHHAVETDTAGKNRYYLRISRHSRREEDDRDEHEQRTEHVDEVRYEIEIIIEDDGMQRGLLRYEIINLLADVKNDDDADYQQEGDDERPHESLENIPVYLLWCKVHTLQSSH